LNNANMPFKQAPIMLGSIRNTGFGPYPFYEDSYKLLKRPIWVMEHQSSVTYGNGLKNGYRGTDLSNTGGE